MGGFYKSLIIHLDTWMGFNKLSRTGWANSHEYNAVIRFPMMPVHSCPLTHLCIFRNWDYPWKEKTSVYLPSPFCIYDLTTKEVSQIILCICRILFLNAPRPPSEHSQLSLDLFISLIFTSLLRHLHKQSLPSSLKINALTNPFKGRE